MSTGSHRKRNPKPDRRRALELLASCRDGCTEAMMRAHGFTVSQMVNLVTRWACDRVHRAHDRREPHDGDPTTEDYGRGPAGLGGQSAMKKKRRVYQACCPRELSFGKIAELQRRPRGGA
jgi:hypothetical protein